MKTAMAPGPSRDLVIKQLFTLHGKHAVVTGGNAGIGEALATALGLAGATLLLVARRETELQVAARQDRAEPVLASGEVVLRIDAAGICGSDMHAYHGHDPRRLPGLVLGHEFAATVAHSAHPRWREGQRVTGNPLITSGLCDYCLQGRDNLCSLRTMVGMQRPGAFAQQMGIPGSSLIELPDGLPATAAALTEPAATALRAVNQSLKSLLRPLPECRVLILGGGAIGMLAAPPRATAVCSAAWPGCCAGRCRRALKPLTTCTTAALRRPRWCWNPSIEAR